MKSRLGNLKLYKFDVHSESDVGVLLVSHEGINVGHRFRLTQHTGQGRNSKAGLSKSFVDMVNWFFVFDPKDSNITNQIFTYIASNFCFKDLEIVPPACHVLVFHVDTREFDQDLVPDIDIASEVLSILGTEDAVLSVEVATTRLVPIDPPTTEILDGYQSLESSCCLCEQGFPKEDEIVHKTRCNHIFHGNCISRYLLRSPRCPVCYTDLLPVDIRTLLFF